MIRSIQIFTVIISLLFFGCKSTKRLSSSGNVNNSLTSNELIKNHQKQEVHFKTMQSKVKVEHIQGDRSHSYTINLRMEMDKIIWMSSTLGIVRVKITPERVSYYNKLDNTYFDGDFSLISDFLGTELNFVNVQNLLLGEAIFDLENQIYKADIHEESYVLFPEDQNSLYEIFFLLNPSHFKMDSQQLAQSVERRMLQIDYNNYQEVEEQILPESIKLIALEADEETIVNMKFRSVILNNELRFPFRIPSGFDEIEIK